MKTRAWFLAAAVMTAMQLAWAQAPGQDAAGVPAHMIVTAEAHQRGAAPPSINPEDVMAMQNRQHRQVTGWVPFQGNNSSLQFLVLIDDSLNPALGSNLSELRSFITSLPGSASFGIAYMRNGAANIVQPLTADHAKAAAALRLPLGAGAGSSSPYEAVSDLIKKWGGSSSNPSLSTTQGGGPQPVRREILMISDGIEPFGVTGPDNSYVNGAIEAAQKADVVVFTIFASGEGHYGHTLWRINWGQSYLSRLADETGGEGYIQGFETPVSMTPYLRDLSTRLQHQYLLTFLAQPQHGNAMVPVTVTTEVPKVDLVAADKVYVPAG